MAHRIFEMTEEETQKLSGPEVKALLFDYLFSIEDKEELAEFQQIVSEVKKAA